MVVDTLPYGNVNDLAAVATALDHMAKAMLTVPGLTYLYGPYASGADPQCAANLTAAEFLASVGSSFCWLTDANSVLRFLSPMLT